MKQEIDNFQDKIDDYIFDRMSNEERSSFEAEISTDAAKKEQLEFTQNVKRAISSRQEKLQKIKMMQEAYMRDECDNSVASMPPIAGDFIEQEKTHTLQRTHHRWLWAPGVAAILIIGMIAIKPTRKDLNSQRNEIIRGGEEEQVFDPATPIIADSIPSDSTSTNKKLEIKDE